MRILLAAAPVIHREQAFNLQTILEYMKAYCERAELIVFGEAVLQGFNSLCWHYEEDRTVAVALTDASIVKIRAAAKRRHIAVSFGMIERRSGSLYSTQLFIGADGEIVNVFHRVSPGWKDRSQTNGHYREGARFEKFSYGGKTFAVGLCGDLWTEGRPEEMKALSADMVLWRVWCDDPARSETGPSGRNTPVRQRSAAMTCCWSIPSAPIPKAQGTLPEPASISGTALSSGSILPADRAFSW